LAKFVPSLHQGRKCPNRNQLESANTTQESQREHGRPSQAQQQQKYFNFGDRREAAKHNFETQTSIFELPYHELAVHAEDTFQDYQGNDTRLRWA